MPNRAMTIGIHNVVITAANAAGNAVQRMTRMNTSQTWLASQTAVTERSITSRGPVPRRSPTASRSQTPPPKSAPPVTA